MADSLRDMAGTPEYNVQWGKLAQGAAIGYVLGEQIKGLGPQQQGGGEMYVIPNPNDPNQPMYYFGPSRAQILAFKIKVILVWAAILGFLYWWFFVFE